MDECVEKSFGEKSSFQCFFKLVRYPLGILIFLIPWAMQFGGIVAGPIIIAVFVVINAYRSHVLARVVSELTSNGVRSSSGCSDWWILENSMGKAQKSSVNCYLVIFSAIQWIALLGHASAFFAFAGTNLNQVLPLRPEESIRGDRYWIAICMGVVVIAHPVTQWVRNTIQDPLHRCGCPSIFSVFLLLVIPVIFAVCCGLVIMTVFAIGEALDRIPLIPSMDVDLPHFPLLMSAVIFAVGATPDDVTGSFGALQSKVKYSSLLITAAVVVMVITIGFSVAVFLGLDHNICGSVSYNLPLDETRFVVVRVLLSISTIIFISFRHHIEPHLASQLSTAEVICDIVFKVIFLVVAGSVALGLPKFSLLAALFGSVTSFLLTFVFPFLSDLLLHVSGGREPSSGDDDTTDEARRLTESAENEPSHVRKISVMRVIRDVIFIVLGITGMVLGLIATAKQLETSNGMKSAAFNCTTPNF